MAVIEKLLKQIGLPQSTIKEVLAAEADNKEDFDVSAVVSSFKESQRTLFENDSDLEEKFKSQERGKLLDIWTNKLKKEFGLTSEQVKGLKMEEVVSLAKAESVKNGSKELTQVQEELLAANNKLKEYDEVIIPGVKSEVEREKKQFRINNKLQTIIPVDKLRVPVETVHKIVNADILSKYDLDLDDKGNVNIFEKGGKLHVKNADGTKLLTIDEAIESVLKSNKFIKESNADDGNGGAGAGGAGQRTNVQPTKEELAKMSAGQRKALEHEAKLKAEAEKRKAEAE